jgi:HEAT repeat protein
VRAGAAFALGHIASGAADTGGSRAAVIAALAKVVHDDRDVTVRTWAIDALRRFGPDARDAIPALKARVKGRTPESELAVETLARIGPAAVPALCEAMKEAEGTFRSEIIGHLYEMGPAAKEAVPSLREMLKADSPRDRTAAVAAQMRIAWNPPAGECNRMGEGKEA